MSEVPLGMIFLGRQAKLAKRAPVPNELISKVWRITGLDCTWLTMAEIAKIKPQVEGLEKIENGRCGWWLSIEPRKPG